MSSTAISFNPKRDRFDLLYGRSKDLQREANALLAIWEKRDLTNPDCWRRKYLSKVKEVEAQRIAVDDRIRELEKYFGT